MQQPDIAQDDEQLMSLVDLALAQPSEEREAYLRSACRDNSALFEQAWQYVQWDERMGNFLLDSLYSLEVFDVVFEPGQLLLDGRFRIVRKVGEGGMGIVYEAVDEQVNQRVAIKCAKTGFRKRLPPEVRHAREIAHPNVCKIFDIHKTPTERGEVDFVVMEFLEGETLTDRLQQGALPEKDARTFARQLASGLAAAHRCAVIHGDLKSSNVIVTKASDGTPRAVITDFGLAKGAEGILASAKADGLGVSGGAPDYMAPELWKGQNASVASDIYAFGVVLYEMLTGTRLHAPQAPWEERLTRKPPKVHPRWDGILGRCLDPDPALRYQSVEEIEAALEPRSRRWMLATAAAVVLALAAVVAYEQARAPETVRLAIAPAQNDAATNALLKGAADRLRGVKSSKMRLEVIPPGGQGQRATHVLTVDIQPDKGRNLVRANVADASSLPLKRWQAEYESSELRYLPLALAGVVTGAMHVAPVVAPPTVNFAAAADFVGGVELARRNDRLDAAIPKLEKAVAADWDSPLTHARLAEALLLKYNDTLDPARLERAKVSLENAEKRNPDVALVRLVAGMRSEYIKSFAAAEPDLQRARELDPRNGDVWRHLGSVYVGSNRLTEAEIAYKKAIELEPGYYRNYRELCRYYGDRWNYEEAVRHCKKAIELAPDLAETHFALARVHGIWGKYPEAEQEAREALRLDPNSSRILQTLATTLVNEGRYDDAIPFFERGIETGNELAYSNLGTAYRLAGRHEDANTAYQKAADLAQAAFRKNINDGLARAHFAYAKARLGDRQRAEDEADQAWQAAPGSVNVAQNLVMTYEALNERDRVLDFLSKAPPEALRRLKQDAQPDLADLHKDSRFQQLVELHNIR